MALTDQEIDSLRFHLGYGNVAVGAEPYTGDTFYAVFEQVVSTYLSTATETTATDAIAAGSTATVTPAAMTGIALNVQLVVGVGDQAEIVVPTAVTGSTFTAYFTKAHAATGYPIGTLRGVTRLRMLLHQAEQAWQSMTDTKIGKAAGLKSVDKGDVEWFQGFQVLKDRLSHYRAIVMSLSSLVRVPPLWLEQGRGSVRLEAY